MDYQKGIHKGFAFVEYEDPEVRIISMSRIVKYVRVYFYCLWTVIIFHVPKHCRMRQKPCSTWTAPNSWEEP
jgi:hypothetical protein